jgi:DNA-directed RNA polymerase I subunit RPA49
MGSEKRKRSGDSTKPKKKVVIDAPPSSATVSSVLRPKFCPPVIGTNHHLCLSAMRQILTDLE